MYVLRNEFKNATQLNTAVGVLQLARHKMGYDTEYQVGRMASPIAVSRSR